MRESHNFAVMNIPGILVKSIQNPTHEAITMNMLGRKVTRTWEATFRARTRITAPHENRPETKTFIIILHVLPGDSFLTSEKGQVE